MVPGGETILADQPSRLARFLKGKFHYLWTLLSEDELKSVLAASVEEIPGDASYKIDDCVHAMIGGSLPVRLNVYGAKAGGYGMVYTVVDADNLRRYCLKVPRGPMADEREERRTRKEATTWINLGRHSNIACAHSLLEINSSLAILIEYVSGRDLLSRLRQGALSIREALSYGIQICRGMGYAQMQLPGFVHGDIKPSNCLLTTNGGLKITDFGQVRSIVEATNDSPAKPAAAAKMSETLPQVWAAGTPAYMAPEQFDAANETGISSDVYSFGTTLFEMITGQTPFAGRDHEECFEQHTRAVPRAPVSLDADVPAALSDLVMRCLAKSPSDRPSDFPIIEVELCKILRDTFGEVLPEIAQDSPTEVETIGQCAALCVLGQSAEAIQSLDKLLLVNSRSAEAWVLKGKAFSLIGSHEEALDCYKRSLDLDPRLSSAWSHIGEVLNHKGLHLEALNYFDRAIAINRRVPAFWNHKGRTLFGLRRTGDAAKCFRRALAVDPHHADSHRALGELYFEQGDVEDAVKCFQRAVALDAQSVETRCLLADAYNRLGMFEEAIETCREALASKPKSELLTRLKTAYRALYRKRDDATVTERAERLVCLLTDEQPGDVDSIVGQCLPYLSACEYDPLVFYLCAFRLHAAAEVLRNSGRDELRRALTKVRNRLYDESPHRPTFYWLGRLYYRLGDYDDCAEIYSESIARLGVDDKALYYLAACHELKGEYEQALIHYKQVLALDPQCHLTPKAIHRIEALIAKQVTTPADGPIEMLAIDRVQGLNQPPA